MACSRRQQKQLRALVPNVHHLGASELFTGTQLLPRFVVFVSSTILVPVFRFRTVQCDSARTQPRSSHRQIVRRGSWIRLVHAREPTKTRPRAGQNEQRPDDVMPTPDQPKPLAHFVRTCNTNLPVMLDACRNKHEDDIDPTTELHLKGSTDFERFRYSTTSRQVPISELEAYAHLFDINDPQVRARNKRILDLLDARNRLGMLALAVTVAECVAVVDHVLGKTRASVYSTSLAWARTAPCSQFARLRYRPLQVPPRSGQRKRTTTCGKVSRGRRRLHVNELPQDVGTSFPATNCRNTVGPRLADRPAASKLLPTNPLLNCAIWVRASRAGHRSTTAESSDASPSRNCSTEFFYLRHV